MLHFCCLVSCRPLGSSYIHYAESSMKNGFGLKYLHRFFNIPFLQLQVTVLPYSTSHNTKSQSPPEGCSQTNSGKKKQLTDSLLPLYLFQGPVSELCILMTGLACMQPHQIPKPCYLQYYNVAAKINANVPGSVQDPSGIPLFPVCVIREKLF